VSGLRLPSLQRGVERDGVLLVHTSFRATRPVEGGPGGLIDALRDALGPEGTLVMPCWPGDDDVPFDPANTPAAADLGVVAETFRRLPGVVRSDHPFSFAAIGPRRTHRRGTLPLPPHGPRARGDSPHTSTAGHPAGVATTGHHAAPAEGMAGVPYAVPNHCTVLEDGRSVRIDYGRTTTAARVRWRTVAGERAGKVEARGHATRASRALARHRRVARSTSRDPIPLPPPARGQCPDCAAARELAV